ncbi:MAG: zf-HC2 domain-containing protein, partial [Gemmatimonadaceae bacterium]
MQHLDEGTIHAWLDGELPFAERESAELHVASCAECAAAVAEARGFIAASSRILTALDAVPGGVLPAEPARVAPRARRFTVPRAWMAVAALLVLGIGTVIARRSRPDLVPLPVAENRDAKSNAAPVAEPSAIVADTTQVATAAPAPLRAPASNKPQMSNEALQKPASVAGKVAAK